MATPKWYVLTGGPSAGKTTVLNALKERGFHTVPEASRTFIDGELAKGRTIEDIRRNELTFQRDLLPIKLDTERELSPDEVTFFDRGMHDSVAYYALCGVTDDPELKEAVDNASYAKVFLFDPLEFKQDGVRTETKEQAERIQKLLKQAYEDAKIPLVQIPVLSVEDRVAFILSHI
jgi:predicted ATPase